MFKRLAQETKGFIPVPVLALLAVVLLGGVVFTAAVISPSDDNYSTDDVEVSAPSTIKEDGDSYVDESPSAPEEPVDVMGVEDDRVLGGADVAMEEPTAEVEAAYLVLNQGGTQTLNGALVIYDEVNVPLTVSTNNSATHLFVAEKGDDVVFSIDNNGDVLAHDVNVGEDLDVARDIDVRGVVRHSEEDQVTVDDDLNVEGGDVFNEMGELTLRDHVNLGGEATDGITFVGMVDSDVLPMTSSFYDLGDVDARWERIFADIVNIYTELNLRDDVRINFGDDKDAAIEWDTLQSNDEWVFSVSGSNNITIFDKDDDGANFAHASATNPTLYIQSADSVTVADYLRFWHDQTDSNIHTGTGGINVLATNEGGDVVVVAGDGAPSAGENGNDVALEAEDDFLVQVGDDSNLDVAGSYFMDAGEAFSIDSVDASNVTVTSDAAADDFTVSLAGATNSSLILSSTGTGADALQITTTAGGLDMTVAGNLAGEDLDINATGATTEIRVATASTEADAFRLNASAGGIDIDANNSTFRMTNTADGVADDFTIEQVGAQNASLHLLSAGTFADAITIVTSAGGMDITVAGASAGEDMDISSNSSINITSTEGVADGIVVTSTNGGIDMTAAGNAAGEDFDINATGALTEMRLTSQSTQTDAILLNATGGGIDIDAANSTLVVSNTANGAGDDFTIEQLGAQNASLHLASAGTEADAMTLTTSAGGLDISVTGDAAGEDLNLTTVGAATEIRVVSASTEDDAISVSATADTGGVHILAGDGEAAVIGTDESIELSASGNIELQAIADVRATLPAAGSVVVDASSTASTNTDGALDINFDSVTTASEAVNIFAGSDAGGSDNDIISALVIDLDDDSDAATGALRGIEIAASDTTGSAIIAGIYLDSSLEQGMIIEDDTAIMFGTPTDIGVDGDVSMMWDNTAAALEIDGGLVTIGQDPTADTSTGDGDLFVEDALEVEGVVDLDGSVDFDGTTADFDGTGLISLTSTLDAAQAMLLSTTVGGIDINVAGDSAGDDLNLLATGTSVQIEATEAVADAVLLDASTDGGGVRIIAGDNPAAARADNNDIEFLAEDDFLFSMAAGSQISVDADTTDSTTAGAAMLIDVGSVTSGNIGLQVDYDVVDDNGVDTQIAFDVLLDMSSNDGDAAYGIRVQDLAGSAAGGNEYAIYQAGTGWDRGLLVEDTAELTGAVSFGSEVAFGGADTTPSVSAGSYFTTDGTAQTLTDFDDSVDGQIIVIESTDATVFDCATAGPLLCGDDAENLTTADNDTTTWIANGSLWHLVSHVSADTQQTGADVAEYMKSDQSLDAGTVVVAHPSKAEFVVRSEQENDSRVVGIVADVDGVLGDLTPGLMLGNESDGTPVTLAGRVWAKFDSANGDVSPGDPLTTAPDGRLMKAVGAGPTVGKALSGESGGYVIVLVNIGWFDPAEVSLSELEAVAERLTAVEALTMEAGDVLGDDDELVVLNEFESAEVGTLRVLSAAEFEGTLAVADAASFGSDVIVVGDVRVGGDLNVAGAMTQTFAGDGVDVGDVVFVDGDGKVRKADAGDLGKLPAVGVVASVGEAGVEVAVGGTVKGMSGLSTGARYFVAVGGGMTTAKPEGEGYGVQAIGVARSESELLVMPGLDYDVVEADPPAGGEPEVVVETVVEEVVVEVEVPAEESAEEEAEEVAEEPVEVEEVVEEEATEVEELLEDLEEEEEVVE